MKGADFKLLFGSIIVSALLVLYAYSLIAAITLARSVPAAGETVAALGPGIGRTLATVGGLVSALVISVLAITKPGESPGATLFVPSDARAQAPDWVGWLSSLYILAWILLGLAAYYFGELRYPDKVPELTDYAQAWLGLAVAAGYSYFALK